MKLEDRMVRSIALRKGFVVLRSDFTDMGVSDSQITRVLNKLIARGFIQRVSHGAFVKTRLNKFTGELTPAASLEVVAKELFEKLKVDVLPSNGFVEYNSGLTTQIPPGGAVRVKGRRINRKIVVAGREIRYEKSPRKPLAHL